MRICPIRIFLKSWILNDKSSQKAVFEKKTGEIDDVMVKDPYCEIYVAKRRNQGLAHYEKAYSDAFIHEMIHALAYKMKRKYCITSHGLSHSNGDRKYFDRCVNILMNVIFNLDVPADS